MMNRKISSKKFVPLVVVAWVGGFSSSQAVNVPVDPIVKMVSVPDYLFASAEHATPVKFKILNAGNVSISSVTAEFYIEGVKRGTYTTTSRFVANDGPDRENGSSSVYTCFIASSFYDGMLVPEHRVLDSKSKFRVKVSFYSPSLKKSFSDKTSVDWGEVKVYADEEVDCVDLGTDKNFSMQSSTQVVSKPGEAKFEVLGSSVSSLPVGLVFSQGEHNVWGFDRAGDEAFVVAGETDVTKEARVKLFDDTDLVSYGVGQTYRARAYGVRHGAYMFFSYWGKEQSVLWGDELAMDLGAETGVFEVSIADSVVNTVVCESGADTAIIGQVGVASNFAGLVSVFITSNPWGLAFGTATSIAALYADFDSGTTHSAEAYISQIDLRLPRDGSEPIISTYTLAHARGNASDVTNDNPQYSGVARVGDEFVVMVDLNVAANAGSYNHPVPGSVKAESIAVWAAESAEDFSTLRIKTY